MPVGDTFAGLALHGSAEEGVARSQTFVNGAEAVGGREHDLAIEGRQNPRGDDGAARRSARLQRYGRRDGAISGGNARVCTLMPTPTTSHSTRSPAIDASTKTPATFFRRATHHSAI